MSYRPFWIIDGDESYECNSGISFSVFIYAIDASGHISPILVSLCKPQIYGLWHCLWNNTSHISSIKESGITGIIVINKETQEFKIMPIQIYYPFPHIFPIQPHCINSKQFQEFLLHIDRSIESFSNKDQLSVLFQMILKNTIPCMDDLFSILGEVVMLDPIQKNYVIENWSRKIIKDIVINQDDEYGISL